MTGASNLLDAITEPPLSQDTINQLVFGIFPVQAFSYPERFWEIPLVLGDPGLSLWLRLNSDGVEASFSNGTKVLDKAQLSNLDEFQGWLFLCRTIFDRMAGIDNMTRYEYTAKYRFDMRDEFDGVPLPKSYEVYPNETIEILFSAPSVSLPTAPLKPEWWRKVKRKRKGVIRWEPVTPFIVTNVLDGKKLVDLDPWNR